MTPVALTHLKGKEAEARYHLNPSQRDLFHQRSPIITTGDSKAKIEEIRHYVHTGMELFEAIFDSLASAEAFYVPPVHKLRHPMIFYYGHTASFYINKLCVAGLIPHIDPAMEEMFAIGVDEMSWDDLNEGHYNWPKVEAVCEYRRKVRDTIDQLMTSGKYPLQLPLTFESSTANDANAFWWVMLMGAEHERIHIETASVHLRELPMEYVNSKMTAFWKRCPLGSATQPPPANELVSIAAGTVSMGRPLDHQLYGWDSDYANESGRQPVAVAAFKASRYLVSNHEFLQGFLKDGGYTNREYWDEEGWRWVQWKKPQHPWFWVADSKRPNGYGLRLQTEVIDLPLDWPCEINNLEAHAVCQYLSRKLGKTIRMPTEEEWTLLYDRFIGADMPAWPAGKPAPGNVNMEQGYASSCPVNTFQHGDLYDVIGNVWQHAEDKVYPFPGYQVHPFYDDFSRPTFDGLHGCIKGGAWVSTGNEATRDARFAFRRHFFQFTGLRYVEAAPVKVREVTKLVGVDEEVDRITDTHFRPMYQGVPNGPVRIAQHALEVFRSFGKVAPGGARRAMDLFCGAGRVSYELSAEFEEVVGVDFSARRLIPAFALKERGECEYLTDRGQAGKEAGHTVSAEGFAWGSGAQRERVTFFQSDPVNLHAHLSRFSLIVCWNCLEQSYQPSAVPPHLLSRLEPGGVLLIGTDGHFQERAKTHQRPGYVADALVVAETKKVPPHDTIFELLGGAKAVERVGSGITTIPVAFMESSTSATVREIHFAAYRKLQPSFESQKLLRGHLYLDSFSVCILVQFGDEEVACMNTDQILSQEWKLKHFSLTRSIEDIFYFYGSLATHFFLILYYPPPFAIYILFN
eukprot:gene837-475_t